MAIQLSTTARNSMLDIVETDAGTGARLKIWSGAQPATCATADSGTLLVDMTLPTDWMNAASGGTKTLLGSWQDTSADGTGAAGHFRIYDSTATTCTLQGSAGDVGTEDLVLDNASINSGQQVTITAFTITAPGA
jgi:hypothetical protein